MSLHELEQFLLNDLKNGVTIEKFREMWERTKSADKKAILLEIDKGYTVEKLKKKVNTYSGEKKADMCEKYFRGLLRCFHVHSEMFSYSYSFSGGGFSHNDSERKALENSVNKTTQKDLDDYRDKYAARLADIKKTMSDPETLAQFEMFVRVKGQDALSDTQRLRYDELKAEKTLQAARREAEQRASVTAGTESGLTAEIVETTHTKAGYPLFVVVLSKRVERETYNSLSIAAKRLGGWYSSFSGNGAIPGFQFKEKENANNFLLVVNGGHTDGSEVVEAKEEKRSEAKANKFSAMSEKLRESGNEELNRERKANTARRARMAANAEEAAQDKLFWSGILAELSNRLDNGSLKYLAGISALTQLKALNSMLKNGHYNRMRAENLPSWETQPFDFEKTVPHISRAFATVHREVILDLIKVGYRIKGQKMRCDNLLKIVKKSKIDKISFSHFDGIEMLAKLADHAGVLREVERVRRLRAAGINDDAVLRMALREFLEIKNSISALTSEQRQEIQNREIERRFVGAKIPGFFPTPPDLIEKMISKAGLFPECKVLEPSAGLGHILCAVAEHCPTAILEYCEIHSGLREAITARNFQNCNTIGQDFLNIEPREDYDIILMNPPFEDRQDEKHIMHAYRFLKPGGTLIAIMANRQGQDRSKDFFNWLENVGGYAENNEPDAFKSAYRPTGVNTIMVTIDR